MKATQEILARAKKVKSIINFASTEQKNLALTKMAEELILHQDLILEANEIDMNNARGNISDVMLDRLLLNKQRIKMMADGILEVVQLEDPVGIILEEKKLASGLHLSKISTAFGVLGMIYESRPNVTADVAALAIKSGNAVVLRGGKEAYHCSKAICDALRIGIEKAGMEPDIVQLIEDISRASSKAMMMAKGYLDLLIPRGGKSLIQTVVNEAIVPIIETGTGICHLFIDQTADVETALRIVDNAKTSRPSVCNSIEVCLVHEAIADEFLPKLAQIFENRVEIRADQKAITWIPSAVPAGIDDFDTEFLDYIMAVKIVSSVEEAIEHINTHSTGHSESILTDNQLSILQFTQQVDSSSIYVNASTRFTDGGEFGLGCEIGISTQKMHARGPMGLKELTTYKYIMLGNGQIR